MVRLKDIAERVGVSVMTVSKALRDASDVSAATRARIQEVARQLGYVPDSTARGLRTRRTRLLGLLVASCADPVLGEAIAALEQRAVELGFDLLVSQTSNRADREEAGIRRFLSRRVDGLVAVPAEQIAAEVRVYQELIARQVPTVILGPAPLYCARFPAVAAGELAGSQALTQCLLDLGHRRIAYFAGPPGAGWAQQRFSGYRAALRQYGLSVEDGLIFQAGRSLEEGVQATRQFLEEEVKATAIQVSSDAAALGCMELLLDRGLRVPQDISVAGFGDAAWAAHARVPLTTVRLPKAALGTAAADAVAAIIRKQSPATTVLTAELVVRHSTGIPPATHQGQANV